MARKTLAEQIAELSEPSKDFDIEDNEIAEAFSSGSENSDAETATHHYVPVSKSKLRKEQALLSDKKYSGQVTSRDSIFGKVGEGSEEVEEVEELNEQEESDESEESNESEDSNESNEQEESNELNELEDSNESEDSNELNESEDSNESDSEHELSSVRSKIKDIMAKERKHIVSRLSESAANDASKGYAILQQHKEFDALIDARLKIQKALTESNMLPVSAVERFSSKKSNHNINAAKDACYDLLEAIHGLRGRFLQRDRVVAEPTMPKKRSLQEYSQASVVYDTALEQHRATVLNKWSAKIQNSSGASAMNANKFKALNQSAEQQVVNNLQDMDRLVKRTRLNRRKIIPMGSDGEEKEREEKEREEKEREEREEKKREEKEKDHINPAQSRNLNLHELETIFDDEDFYRVLLNDLVDKKIQTSDPTSGLQFALKGAASSKLKKNVDNKASKGRRLRYHVHEKLANFDTPKPWVKWNDDQIDEFFASLLGQKVSMQEESESESSNDEDEMIVPDSIQLFG